MYELMRCVCDWISLFILLVTSVVVLGHFLKTLLALLRSGARRGGHVLVTGCDSGFGYGTAIELSHRKFFVFAGCLSRDGAERLQSDPTFSGEAFVMDITKSSDIENAKQMIGERVKGKGLWAVVNNAGIGELGLIEWQSIDTMQRVMDVNLWGAVNVTKAMLPLVKEARGRVVNLTSMAGRVLMLHGTAYTMAKHALEAFSDGLRYEMKPWGVSVHIVEPGIFHTSMTDIPRLQQQITDTWKMQPQEIRTSYGEQYYEWVVEATGNLITTLGSHRTGKVVNALCHAVTSLSPKLRYVVGVDANTIWMAIATFPTSVGDFILNCTAKPATPAARKIS